MEKGGNRQGEGEKGKKREERVKLGRFCLSGRHRIARRIKNLSKKYSHCKSSHLQSTPAALGFLPRYFPADEAVERDAEGKQG